MQPWEQFGFSILLKDSSICSHLGPRSEPVFWIIGWTINFVKDSWLASSRYADQTRVANPLMLTFNVTDMDSEGTASADYFDMWTDV